MDIITIKIVQITQEASRVKIQGRQAIFQMQEKGHYQEMV